MSTILPIVRCQSLRVHSKTVNRAQNKIVTLGADDTSAHPGAVAMIARKPLHPLAPRPWTQGTRPTLLGNLSMVLGVRELGDTVFVGGLAAGAAESHYCTVGLPGADGGEGGSGSFLIAFA